MIDGLERLRKLVFPGSGASTLEPPWLSAHRTMVGLYNKYEYYYSGDVLRRLADPKLPEDSPLQYPLQINLCKEWADMLASYIFGQWDEHVVTHLVDRKEQESGKVAELEEQRCQSMEDVLRFQWEDTNADSLADMSATSMMVYGGFVVKTYWDFLGRRIVDDWISPDIFLPRWNPMNVNELLEVIVAYAVSRQDAVDIYQLSPYQAKSMPTEVLIWERWTKKTFDLFVEDLAIRENNGNPLGFIPHVYIPRQRCHAAHFGYYGASALENTMALQDEINERAADVGDGVAYSSHPIRVIVNYSGKEDLAIGPDAIWDLGYGFGGREPKAFTLETTGNYTQAMEYIRQVELMGRNVGHLPPIAFGEDEGSQRSGTTLLIRFLPLTQEVRRTRLYLQTGLHQRAKNVLRLAAAHPEVFPGIRFGMEDLEYRTIKVQLAPILPKDISDKVNEWAVRIPAGFGTPEQAYQDLGHPEPMSAAEEALEYQQKMAKMVKQQQGGTNGRPAGQKGNESKSGSSSGPSDRKAKESGSQGGSPGAEAKE
jgi:hypothetical protein